MFDDETVSDSHGIKYDAYLITRHFYLSLASMNRWHLVTSIVPLHESR